MSGVLPSNIANNPTPDSTNFPIYPLTTEAPDYSNFPKLPLNAENLFKGCKIISLIDFSYFNMSLITEKRNMISGITSLKYINIYNAKFYDVEKVILICH